jgi:hypothetical protein
VLIELYYKEGVVPISFLSPSNMLYLSTRAVNQSSDSSLIINHQNQV